MVRVGINGFDSIGRLVLHVAQTNPDVKVVAINNPFIPLKYMAYLLKYDTVHGRFNGTIEIFKKNVLSKVNPLLSLLNVILPKSLGLKKVLNTLLNPVVSLHFQKQLLLIGGAKKVIITAPSKDAPMFICGAISNASCITNRLAPLAKVIHDEFAIIDDLKTTVHSTTVTPKSVDSPSNEDWRRGRAAQAVGKAIPALNGRLTGMAFRIPTNNVSVVDLNVNLQKETNYETIKATAKKASVSKEYKAIIAYTEEALLNLCIFDATAGIQASPTFVKLIAWYDNEYGYTLRVLDLLVYVAKVDGVQ